MNTLPEPQIIVKKNLFPWKKFHSPRKPVAFISPEQFVRVREFNKRIKSGEIQFESVSCLCQNNEFDLIASVDRYGFFQKTIICRNCGLIQSNPRMTNAEYSKFYSSDLYSRCYQGEDYLSISKKRYNMETGRHIFDEINKLKRIDKDTTVFEFGAGGGWNLLPFIKAGAKVIGVDYSHDLVRLGREYGINMIQGGVDKIEGSFDIVILSHVLEHILDPIDFLKCLTRNLKRDGIIYIAVPNILNFDLPQIQNAHVYYFVPETFRYYCSQAGLFQLAEGTAQDIHMFGIFSPTINPANFMINGHYKNIVVHLHKMKTRLFIRDMISYSGLRPIVKIVRGSLQAGDGKIKQILQKNGQN